MVMVAKLVNLVARFVMTSDDPNDSCNGHPPLKYNNIFFL